MRSCVQNLYGRTEKFTRTLRDFSQSFKEMSEFYLKLSKTTSFRHLLIRYLTPFAKLRKVTISFVRMEYLGSHWTDFHEI